VGDEAVAVIRSWKYAVSVLGASGIKPPYLLTGGSGQDIEIKRAFMSQSTDLIVPVPSFKWSKFSGRKFLNARKSYGTLGTMFLITVYPHEDTKDPESVRSLGDAIREHFIEGIGTIAQYSNTRRICLAKALFHPEPGFYPNIELINDGVGNAEVLPDLEALYERENPDRRSDIRLLVCIQLALQDVSGAPGSTKTAVSCLP
jgi:hypothetical protein